MSLYRAFQAAAAKGKAAALPPSSNGGLPPLPLEPQLLQHRPSRRKGLGEGMVALLQAEREQEESGDGGVLTLAEGNDDDVVLYDFVEDEAGDVQPAPGSRKRKIAERGPRVTGPTRVEGVIRLDGFGKDYTTLDGSVKTNLAKF